MNYESTPFALAVGACAGLVGTFVIQGFLTASQRWAPQALPPIKQDPGEFMISQIEKQIPANVLSSISPVVEKSAAKSLAIGYGATLGALYGLWRRRPRNVLLDGSMLGLAAWSTGYLGWLPASGLMPPVVKQNPPQVAGPILSHLVFGIVTVECYRWLQKKL